MIVVWTLNLTSCAPRLGTAVPVHDQQIEEEFLKGARLYAEGAVKGDVSFMGDHTADAVTDRAGGRDTLVKGFQRTAAALEQMGMVIAKLEVSGTPELVRFENGTLVGRVEVRRQLMNKTQNRSESMPIYMVGMRRSGGSEFGYLLEEKRELQNLAKGIPEFRPFFQPEP